MLDRIMELYSAPLVTLGMVAYFAEKNIDFSEVDDMPENEKLDIIADFAMWHARNINIQCERNKREEDCNA